MIVLVCGGRTYSDRISVEKALTGLHSETPIRLLVHGGARGADTLAHEWARYHTVACAVYPADWDSYGTAAGSIRNQHMLDVEKPDLVMAFPGGIDMVRRASKAGVRVLRVS